MSRHITSPHNAIIRHAEQLMRKSRARRKEGLFIVEGRREVSLCVAGGYQIEKLIVCPEIFGLNEEDDGLDVAVRDAIAVEALPPMVTVTAEVYDKLAYRGSVEGVIAFAKAKKHSLKDLKLPTNPLILIAESPEKPGNLGAILRTADAAAVDAVIIADAKTDLYNPNVLRSSLGCALTVPIALSTSEDCIEFCKENNIDIYAATLQSSKRYDRVDYTTATAIAMGAESTGISQTFRDAATSGIIIPMLGKIDSMNLSVSAAILIYEARKQRDFQ